MVMLTDSREEGHCGAFGRQRDGDNTDAVLGRCSLPVWSPWASCGARMVEENGPAHLRPRRYVCP